MQRTTRQVLWRNLSALMTHHWGAENLNRLAREAKFSPPTALAMKNHQSSVGIDLVAKAARVFHLQAWQLLDPGLDPKIADLTARSRADQGPPLAWPFTDVSLDQYASLKTEQRGQVEGFILGLLHQSGPTSGSKK